MNKGMNIIAERIDYLSKYFKIDRLTGCYEIGFLQNSGGLDDQEWEWLEDMLIIKEIYNSLKL